MAKAIILFNSHYTFPRANYPDFLFTGNFIRLATDFGCFFWTNKTREVEEPDYGKQTYRYNTIGNK